MESLETGKDTQADAAERIEATFEHLIQGQEALLRGQHALRRELSALAQKLPPDLQEIARTVLPGYLERHLDLHVLGPLGEELN